MRLSCKLFGVCGLVALLAGCGSSASSGQASSVSSSSPGRVGGSSTAPSVSTDPGAALPSVQPYPTGTTSPDPRGMPKGVAGVDRSDPAATAVGFAVATWAWDSRIDTSPWNAQHRSAGLATGQYASVLGKPAHAAPGASWNAMEKAKGYTRVTTKVIPTDDAPSASPTKRVFTLLVTVTTVGAKVPTEHLTMFISLNRDAVGQPWQVSSSSVSAD